MQSTARPLALIGVAALAVTLAAGCGSEKAASPVGSAATNSTTTSESQDPPAAIVVRKPVSGARVSSGSVVSGTANVFEANVGVEVLDENGHELAKTFTTATCGTGCVGSSPSPFASRSHASSRARSWCTTTTPPAPAPRRMSCECPSSSFQAPRSSF